ncbi:hypothetical protein MM1S1510930_2484 [Mycobacteroides abscessus subsp. bolletii 1S-151-0930]|nr:hypothetical protein MM1S1510930_2484 [Mycobacteroides abscessus subsp. bolletii 1S-151-0930]EIV10729.1 hypothetical protein MM2B0307_1709 [Mycobacteroides abscessus subsp. bolletii 2B-0307]EIV11600.1 hypothetical protein MM2B0912R_2796 [Mycobacteroides abscessus subsp. bolletii 2B-0912-R]
MLGIRQCINWIDTEFTSAALDFARPDDCWTGAFSADQHGDGIMQDIATGEVASEVPFGGEILRTPSRFRRTLCASSWIARGASVRLWESVRRSIDHHRS